MSVGLRALFIASGVVLLVGTACAECPSPLPAQMSKEQLDGCLLEISSLRNKVNQLTDQIAHSAGAALVVGDPVDFSNQFSEIPIPNNEKAKFCALNQVASATSTGGTGYCQVRFDKNTQQWMMQSGPGVGYARCVVTCIK